MRCFSTTRSRCCGSSPANRIREGALLADRGVLEVDDEQGCRPRLDPVHALTAAPSASVICSQVATSPIAVSA
jgi:hypothetical protein